MRECVVGEGKEKVTSRSCKKIKLRSLPCGFGEREGMKEGLARQVDVGVDVDVGKLACLFRALKAMRTWS